MCLGAKGDNFYNLHSNGFAKSNNNNLEREKNTNVAKCKEVMNLVGQQSVYFYNSCNFSISLNFLINFFRQDKEILENWKEIKF